VDSQSQKHQEGIMPNTTSHGATAPVIDRDTASKLNPLIAPDGIETLERCQAMISDLGYLISGATILDQPLDMGSWYQMFMTISAGLEFELNEMRAALVVKPTPATISTPIDVLDRVMCEFLSHPQIDEAKHAAIIQRWAESGGLRDVLVGLENSGGEK